MALHHPPYNVSSSVVVNKGKRTHELMQQQASSSPYAPANSSPNQSVLNQYAYAGLPPPPVVTKKMPPFIAIYTDGSCADNGTVSARAGCGVWVGDGDERNVSCVLPSIMPPKHYDGPEIDMHPIGKIIDNPHSSSRAELYAMWLALHMARTMEPTSQPIVIYSDSKYTLDAMKPSTKSAEATSIAGLYYPKNYDLMAMLNHEWQQARAVRSVVVDKVPGHAGVRGNEEVDKLAKAAIGLTYRRPSTGAKKAKTFSNPSVAAGASGAASSSSSFSPSSGGWSTRGKSGRYKRMRKYFGTAVLSPTVGPPM